MVKTEKRRFLNSAKPCAPHNMKRRESALRRLPFRLLSNVIHDPKTNCMMWRGAAGRAGYGTIGLPGLGSYPVHRLSFELFHAPIPDGMFVCHSCDNPSCINPDHLWLGTSADNNRDMAKKKRGAVRIGESNTQAKLSAPDIKRIRNLSSVPGVDLAKEYGVSPATICDIRKGRSWPHVD